MREENINDMGETGENFRVMVLRREAGRKFGAQVERLELSTVL